MQSLGKTGSDANGAAAAACYTNQSTCSSTCSDLASKYQTLADNCDSCASISIYESTAQTLLSLKSSCDRLAAQVQSLNNQAIAANSSGTDGNLCQQVTQPQTQSVSGPPGTGTNLNAGPSANNPYDCEQNHGSATCQGCRINPDSLYCKSILEGQRAETGIVRFQTSEKSSGSPSKSENFNVFPSSYPDSNSRHANPSAQVAAHTIPNDSGAPPQGGSGFEGMTPKPKTVQAGTNTDILEDSTRLGGGYSYGGSQNPNDTNRSPSGGRAQNVAGTGFDLKSHLLSWLRDRLPSGWFRSLSGKNSTRLQSCANGDLHCDVNAPYPQSMGSLDGDFLPPPGKEPSKVFVILFSSIAALGAFASVVWTGMNWPIVKLLMLKFASRLPWTRLAATAKSVPPPNRRSRDIPIQSNRRAS